MNQLPEMNREAQEGFMKVSGATESECGKYFIVDKRYIHMMCNFSAKAIGISTKAKSNNKYIALASFGLGVAFNMVINL